MHFRMSFVRRIVNSAHSTATSFHLSIQQVEGFCSETDEEEESGAKKRESEQTCYRFYMFSIWDTKAIESNNNNNNAHNLICCASGSSKGFNEPREAFRSRRESFLPSLKLRTIVKILKRARWSHIKAC